MEMAEEVLETLCVWVFRNKGVNFIEKNIYTISTKRSDSQFISSYLVALIVFFIICECSDL